MSVLDRIEVGDQVFGREGGDEFGAVRVVRDDGLVIYIENDGDEVVPLEAIVSAHDGKVIVDVAKLPQALREKIAHAHDGEEV